MRIHRSTACVLAGLASSLLASAQPFSVPLEIRQHATPYNFQAAGGVPISTTAGAPPGSNGEGPTVQAQQDRGLTTLPATPSQFQTLVSFGGVAAPNQGSADVAANVTLLNPAANLAANARRIGLPSGPDGRFIVLLAQVGAPFMSRGISFLFGAPIPVPDADEFGVPLAEVNSGVSPARPIQRPEDYWLAEPFTTTDHAKRGYYWSVHARRVFAIQPGPIDVVWKKSVPALVEPADYGSNPEKYSEEGGSYYTLFAKRYVVSGSPSKAPRKIYWTERSFRGTGKPVAVPTARVSAIQVVYNNNFPERVAAEFRGVGESSIVENPTNTLQELRTLWYDSTTQNILAYNWEGRVFLELLGDAGSDSTSLQHLGFEIVDVIRQPNPKDVTIELGELLEASPGEIADDSHLFPEPVQVLGESFAFRHIVAGSQREEYFATRETKNLNDYQVHWLEEGLEGLKWPFLFVRYRLRWPAAVDKYSHYVRPLVADEVAARATAVPLPNENAPFIEYQDPLDRPRAKLTEKFEFYTYLVPAHPAHRALIRYIAGENVYFERVFSWLDETIKTGNFGGSVATELGGWDPGTASFNWAPDAVAPRLVDQTVRVGDRIEAPPGEAGSGEGENYLAGYILQSQGTSFNPNAYVDPFLEGFEAANRGSIIPVNALLDANLLEVWWFRRNAADLSQGFKPVLWPSVIGRYTLEWPALASEIVLASNEGSGPLNSLQARGSIYVQNDIQLAGYNPNEEHAVLLGGQAFALRDDLNIVTHPGYSSDPFVLLEYTAADQRPAMRLFKVLREKPGVRFDYAIEAGTILQSPMPLPLLEKPLAPELIGRPPLNLNQETVSWMVESANWMGSVVTLTTRDVHNFRAGESLVLQDESQTPAPAYELFTIQADSAAQTIAGTLLDRKPYAIAASIDPGFGGILPFWSYELGDASGLAEGSSILVAAAASGAAWSVNVVTVFGGTVTVDFAPLSAVPDAARDATAILIPAAATPSLDGWRLAPEPIPSLITESSVRERYAAFTIQDRKGDIWVYRGPHRESDAPSFRMQFYYRTLPGFFFPTLPLAEQPPVGIITPYLRAPAAEGGHRGDPVYGNADNDQAGDDNALLVRYSPTWPEDLPVLQMAETLTSPKRGLPAIRGQTSVEIVYQQPQFAGGLGARAVVLHDPTREKVFEFGPSGSADELDGVPASVKTQPHRGRLFFPNLPPHLVDRVFVDPSRGPNGALVFAGEFVDAPVGEKYLLLNVLGSGDLATLRGLCSAADQQKDLWDAAIDRLAATLELFVENPAKPATYIPTQPRTVGPSDLVEVSDDDVAVDSYALTAVGPGVGYVSLLVGNGLAFTPADEPVTLYLLKVSDQLYRGEVNPVTSSNPLNEKLTMQQVMDLAGEEERYTFEWRIAPPVDGLPPVVYENTAVTLVGDGTWTHLRFPLGADAPARVPHTRLSRLAHDTETSVAPISRIQFDRVSGSGNRREFVLSAGHGLVAGNQVVLRNAEGFAAIATVNPLSEDTTLVVDIGAEQQPIPDPFIVFELFEHAAQNLPQSIVFRQFTLSADKSYRQVWLSMDLDAALGAKVYLDGSHAITANLGAADTPMTSPAGDLFPLSRVYRLGPEVLAGGSRGSDGSITHRIVVELFSPASPGAVQQFNLRLEAYEAVDATADHWLPLDPVRIVDGVRAVLGGHADVQSLSDNYVIMRYQAKSKSHASWVDNGSGQNIRWSQWTQPALAEGWIKRVLKGINPFNQRVTDLFRNRVNTDVSIVAQAGPRWEGDVALNLDAINDAGLIEIYETVLRRGRLLSIDGGINYGPANDALLLAAGYLNDLYMMIGNEGWADALNPTIGIGTKDRTYGDIATALFAFRGQTPSLLEEELALLRGRDDFLLPGVQLRPVYNRLFWNYTRGIDAGEVIYALNYNVLDQDLNGVVDADDARRLFPQGHGDAYGHYLTALKGYLSLLMNNQFTWVPRIEAVTVLGKAVSVDYQDERKFAAAAAAVARTGRQTFALTWRRDYVSGEGKGWQHFAATRANTTTGSAPTTRFWGMDHWAVRTGQGAYLNWVIGNAILPAVDADPTHEGIQKVDRTTVPELRELPAISRSLQTALDNAEAGSTPLGLPDGTVPFDLNPSLVVGDDPATHFEQVYERAKGTLRNALAAFDDAKDVTRLMRSEEDSLADLRAAVDRQELAYTHALIEHYGTPYPDDIGPGKTYKTGYNGPDLLHYMYVDTPEQAFPGLLDPETAFTVQLGLRTFTADSIDADGILNTLRPGPALFETSILFNLDGILNTLRPDPAPVEVSIQYTLSSHGFFGRPKHWTGKRSSPGRIQQAISEIIQARNSAYLALYNAERANADLDWQIQSKKRKIESHNEIRDIRKRLHTEKVVADSAKVVVAISQEALEQTKVTIEAGKDAAITALPTSFIAGLSNGGDLASAARSALETSGLTVKTALGWKKVVAFAVGRLAELAASIRRQETELFDIAPEEWNQELREATTALRAEFYGVQDLLPVVNQRLQELDDAQRNYLALVAEGERIQEERGIERQRAAAVIQGFRTRDAAFRVFRNEKLERYKELFDLAARYTFLAAQAFDYETGLLNRQQGREFISRIVSARALGVLQDGEPRFAGSNAGDPGLSSVMAEMHADWTVLKGRLGFNNADAYGTTVSLRSEHFRILPGPDGDTAWKDALHRGRMDNLLEDSDVRRLCMQIDAANGLPVPGILLQFKTVIADGLNLFGNDLAAGDHTYGPDSFATKVYAVGIALEGYQGMDDPSANSSTVTGAGGTSPPDPNVTFLSSTALSATPYVYLIPVGLDSMRTPPLGDTSDIRTWSIDDVSIPLPFNIGGSDFSTKQLWQTSDSLSEPLFSVRKHQSFRPVSSASIFNREIYTDANGLAASQFTNRRLIGRSVWNSRWKLVVPAKTLLNNPDEGLDRFIRTVRDVKIRFVTYSYAGN